MNTSIKVKFMAKDNCVIHTDGGTYFQSYDSLCAFRSEDGQVTLAKNWDTSNTTLKYLKIFLNTNASKAEIQKLIDDGVYDIEK